MTVVIGLSFPADHDSSVAVILDGRLVFATEEERHTRNRHGVDELGNSEPPLHSLVAAFEYLRRLGVRPTDVTAFAVNWEPSLFPRGFRYFYLKSSSLQSVRYGAVHDAKELAKLTLKSASKGFDLRVFLRPILRRVFRMFNAELSSAIKIIAVPHHLAHAASAYYFSGFSTSAVLTIDGAGETESTTVWRVKNGEFEKLCAIKVEDGSLGQLYDHVGQRIGFRHLEGPGKVMGLAPYGRFNQAVSDRFSRLLDDSHEERLPFKFSSSILEGEPQVRGNYYDRLASFLAKGLRLEWDPADGIASGPADLAWALQNFTEDIFASIGRWAKSETGQDKIALAGGVALNAKANMELRNLNLFNDLFVFPAADDAGSPVGAAAVVYEQEIGGKMSNVRLRDAYLGPVYDDDHIKKSVMRTKFRARYVGDDSEEIGKLVADGETVGWFRGRSELGPRALGNRSIISNPTSKDTWANLNELKGREFWRPLAPSIMAESKDDYLENAVDSEFMTLMFRLKEDAMERVPAICHVDGTSRPQTVTKDSNRAWYGMIRGFKEATGESLVVNTSFNLAREPIVEKPEDALSCFGRSGLDALYLSGWLLTKR